jgi:DNA-binding transcriptional MerR regulator
MRTMPDAIPRKLFYKLHEVCELTDTQPYVLRFWESEFAQLAPTRGPAGQRMYRRRDIDLVLQIKKLLNEEGQTIAAARERLGMGEGATAAPLHGLFEPPPAPVTDAGQPAAPSLEAKTARAVATGLRELLDLIERNDARLAKRPAPDAE